jgi:hypothetical protein
MTTIRLIHTCDPYTKLRAGAQGLLLSRRRDPWGEVIDVKWEDGSTLSLIKGEDNWIEEDE